MNKDKTTRKLAIEWWDELPELGKIYAISQDNHSTIHEATRLWHEWQGAITDEKIEEIYLSEHPQPEEQVKEVDILDNKLVRWVEDGCPPIDLNKYPSLVVKLVSENKRLKEVNKLLVDALQPFAKLAYECLNNSNLNKSQDVYAYNNATITMKNLRDVEIALKEGNK